MAFNKRWATPCLLLAALALLAAGVAADTTIISSVTLGAGQAYDGYTLTIDPNLPKTQTPVSVVVPSPLVSGGGLRLVGWDDNSLRGQYLFSYTVSQATVRDSSLVIAKGMPADSQVMIRDTQAVNGVPQPVFDLRDMSLSANTTLVVRNSVVEYTAGAAGEAVVQVGGAARAASVSDHSVLHVLGVTATGGSCVLLLDTPSSAAGLSVTNHSLVAVDVVRSQGASRAALCVDGSLVVSQSSVVRVQDVTLGTAPAPELVLDMSAGVVDINSGSMLVVRDVTAPDSSVLGSTTGAIMDAGVGKDSVISFLDITAKTFCASCSVSGFPAEDDEGSSVYAQGWTMDGAATTDYMNLGLGFVTPLVDLRDGDNKCRSAFCLPANALEPNSNAAQCACSCRAGSYAPMCLGKEESGALNTCTDRNCMECATNAATCTRCRDGFAVNAASGQCEVVVCNVANCRMCEETDADRCATCETGYGLDDGACKPCSVTYCAECGTDPSKCTQCINGLELSQDQTQCGEITECQVANCATCVAGNNLRCRDCQPGYGLLTNGQCGRCSDANCRNCPTNVDRCSECNTGYTLTASQTCSNGGQCVLPNCAECDAQNLQWCRRCVDGYVVSAKDRSCVPRDSCQVDNCATCAAGNPNYCATCAHFYAQSEAGTCYRPIDPNCRVNRCQYCPVGYPTLCQECDPGYAVTSTGKCGPQGSCKVAYCSKCERNNPNWCRTCFSSFSVQPDGTCYPTSLAAAPAVAPRSLLLSAAVVLAAAVAAL